MHGEVLIALLLAASVLRPGRVQRKPRPFATVPQAAGNFTLNVTPAAISFNAVNPGTAPTVPGSTSARITWQVLSGGANWSLKVQAASPSFANCPAIPISAVTVSCASASVSSTVGGSANCAASFPLSTAPVQVAGGSEGAISFNYSVTVNFTLADSWKYAAATNPACSLSLTYTADVP